MYDYLFCHFPIVVVFFTIFFFSSFFWLSTLRVCLISAWKVGLGREGDDLFERGGGGLHRGINYLRGGGGGGSFFPKYYDWAYLSGRHSAHKKILNKFKDRCRIGIDYLGQQRGKPPPRACWCMSSPRLMVSWPQKFFGQLREAFQKNPLNLWAYIYFIVSSVHWMLSLDWLTVFCTKQC